MGVQNETYIYGEIGFQNRPGTSLIDISYRLYIISCLDMLKTFQLANLKNSQAMHALPLLRKPLQHKRHSLAIARGAR